MNDLHPAVRTVWTIKLSMVAAAFFLTALLYDVFHLGSDGGWLPFGVLPLLVALVGGGIVVMLPRLRYRHWAYDLESDALRLERGIWTHVRTIVPLVRVQHLDISQDLVEREYDLSKLIVHTAGTRASTVVLPGLQKQEAETLRDRIQQYTADDSL